MDKRLDGMSVQRRWHFLRQYPCMSDELMDVDAATSSSRVVHIKDLAMPRLRKCPFDIDAIDWRRSEHLGTGVDGVVYRVYFGDKGPFVLKIFWISELNTHSSAYSAVHRECQNAALLQMLRTAINQATKAQEVTSAEAEAESEAEAAANGSKGYTTNDATAVTGAALGNHVEEQLKRKRNAEQNAEQNSKKAPGLTERRPRPTIWPQVYPHPLDFYTAYENLFAFSDEMRFYRQDEQRKKKLKKDESNGNSVAGQKGATKDATTKDAMNRTEVVRSNAIQQPGQKPGPRPRHLSAEQFAAEQDSRRLLLNQERISLTSMPRFATCHGWLTFNVHEVYKMMPPFMRVWSHPIDWKTDRHFDKACTEFYGIVYEYIENEEEKGDKREQEQKEEDDENKAEADMEGEKPRTAGSYNATKTATETATETGTAGPAPSAKRYNLRSSVRIGMETRNSTATAEPTDKDPPSTAVGGNPGTKTRPMKIGTPTVVKMGQEVGKGRKMTANGSVASKPHTFEWKYGSVEEYSRFKTVQEATTRLKTAADAVKYRDQVQAAADFLWLAGFKFAARPLARNWKTGVLVDHSDIIGPYSPGWQRLLWETKWSVDWILTRD